MKRLSFVLFSVLFLFVGCKEKNGIEINKHLGYAFSVSENKQILFSSGNLQYQANTNTWRFAENQYSMIGAANANIEEDNSQWIDLFGWGTGKNPILFDEESDKYNDFCDWGWCIGKDWRTLSQNEWNYLLFKRPNAYGLFSCATIDTICGLLLLPDGLSSDSLTHVQIDETTRLNITFSPNASEWDINTYDYKQWHILDSLGVAFLPITGYRQSTNVYFSDDNVDKYGYYWTSTSNNDFFAYYIEIYSRGVLLNYRNRSYGHAVRLVTNL